MKIPDDLVEAASAEETFETTDYDFAAYFVLADFDYIAQLLAVRELLQRQQYADRLLEHKIKAADEFARRTSGILNEQAIDDYIRSCY
jgi:GNAT superfamily N-acetyltransferase